MALGRGSGILGIAVAERAITCAEVSVAGGRRVARRTATLAIGAELSLENPAALGQALASFLRHNRFGSSRAVVGIGARWLMAVEKEIPPADEQAARAALRLQAERIGSAESGELVFDYAGRIDARVASRVLLVGTLRQRLERIEAVMEAAGLNVIAITSTGLALANCAQKLEENSSIVVLSRGGAEMIWRERGEPRMLRHVTVTMNGHGTPPVAPLAAELRRAVALARTNGQTSGEMMLVDGVGLPGDEIQQIVGKLGVRVRPGSGLDAIGVRRDLPPNDSTSAEPADQYAPALALALAGAEPALLPMDFRHSRLAPPRAKRLDRKAAWGIGAGAVALLAIVLLYISVSQRQGQLDELNAQLEQMKPSVQADQAVVDRVRFGRGYFDQRPAMLEAMRHVTLAFPGDERIWLNNFTLRDNGRGQISGKASDTKVILAVRDRLQNNPRFVDVKMVDMRDADNRSRESTFVISFGFNFVE